MARTIIIGDVHGCRSELSALVDRIGVTGEDRVFFVGDLIVRGPDPIGTLDLVYALRAQSVRGNHEDRLLKYHNHTPGFVLPQLARSAAVVLRQRDWEWMASMPLWLDLPLHNLAIVHAGVVPGTPIESQDPRVLMYIRGLTNGCVPDERRGPHPWGRSYDGPPHLVFGHNAQQAPQVHPWATGIDTGAVYGGRLTAMVLREGEEVPPPANRQDVLISVPAKRRYFGRGLVQ